MDASVAVRSAAPPLPIPPEPEPPPEPPELPAACAGAAAEADPMTTSPARGATPAAVTAPAVTAPLPEPPRSNPAALRPPPAATEAALEAACRGRRDRPSSWAMAATSTKGTRRNNVMGAKAASRITAAPFT
ncbi:MAG TPA: hypothetical protein VGG23_08155, partial [Acidimicrobiales bacterium]